MYIFCVKSTTFNSEAACKEVSLSAYLICEFLCQHRGSEMRLHYCWTPQLWQFGAEVLTDLEVKSTTLFCEKVSDYLEFTPLMDLEKLIAAGSQEKEIKKVLKTSETDSFVLTMCYFLDAGTWGSLFICLFVGFWTLLPLFPSLWGNLCGLKTITWTSGSSPLPALTLLLPPGTTPPFSPFDPAVDCPAIWWTWHRC